MSDHAVIDLAREAGIAHEWIDATGQTRQVGIDSLRSILKALGVSSGTPPIGGESGQRMHRSHGRADVPPLVTMQAGARLVLPKGTIDEGAAREVDGELVDEDGGVRSLRLAVRKQGVVGPVIDRVGYHRLRFADRELTLAVAPMRCSTVETQGGGKRMWGVAAQIYGLRRTGDGGIGDAGAVRLLAEQAARHGADAIALSPAHSLFAADPDRYGPYSPSSRVFLNPLFADPVDVLGTERVAAHRRDDPALHDAPLIDWRRAAGAKFELLRRLFDDFRAHDLTAATPLARDFTRFVTEGGALLRDHALFEALHGKWLDERKHRDWRDWPEGWQRPADLAVAGDLRGHPEAIQYHQFLQWLTDRSFAATQSAARNAGMKIGLIGDLAIGMDRGGSHAWSRQGDLLPGLSIGAPPDAFNRRGQDWGLVGFSPQALVASGFEPFLATVRAAMRHAGGVRIDHIMGLERLWLVPEGAAPSEGAYLSYPVTDLLRLLALESIRHGAVVIGEDLGTVSPGLRRRLQRAGIAGMDVLWFQRSLTVFQSPGRWRADAVAMTTTHDLPTVAGWWRGSDIAERNRFGLAAEDESDARPADRRRLWRAFTRAGAAHGPAPAPDDPQPAVDAALSFVARSRSPLMLAPLEDMLGLAEQPNLPGTIDEHPNWRRRLAPPASSLFEDPDVARRAGLIAKGRS